MHIDAAQLEIYRPAGIVAWNSCLDTDTLFPPFGLPQRLPR